MPFLEWGALMASPAFWLAWLIGACTLYLHHRIVHRIRESDRDTGLGWWLGGTVVLGSAWWAEALIAVMGVSISDSARFMPALMGAAWVPALALAGFTLWLGSQRTVPLVLRVAGCLAVVGALQLIPVMLVSAMLFSPSPDWSGRLALGSALAQALMCVLAAAWGWRASAARPSWLAMGGMVLLTSLGFRVAQSALLSGISVAPGAQSMGDHPFPADVVVPVAFMAALLLLGLMHLGARLEHRWRARERALAASLAQVQTDLAQAAQRDALTGLFNRAGFDQALTQATRGGCDRLAVMRLSLDGHRAMLDLYGHQSADGVLRQLGARLRGLLRQGDAVARAEGEDFLLLLQQPGDRPAMAQLAQRIGDIIRSPFVVEGGDIELTCSIGVALYPDEPVVSRLVDQANEAMQVARASGGAAHCVYEPGMAREVASQVSLQRDLRHAMARGETLLHYQPKLVARTGQLAGVEALMRWRHPQRGMVSPAEFIPVAERFGMIGELGHWVLNEACRQIRVWMDAGLEIPVAVNVSVHQLRQSDLATRVSDALVRHRVPPRLLMLEITESVAMENIDASLRMFDMLASLGVHLSIDDFGTGYSSLAYLRRLPATQLKIDRSFVRDLDDGTEGSMAIVEAVVRLAHALKLTVVAEGVETPTQVERLKALGCDEFQGFWFAKPMPEVELLAWQVQRQTQSKESGVQEAPSRPPRFNGLTTV